METVKIRVIRKFYYDRVVQPVDKIITVPLIKAIEFQAANKAVRVYDPPPPPPEGPPAIGGEEQPQEPVRGSKKKGGT